jgi:hypothetical protein
MNVLKVLETRGIKYAHLIIKKNLGDPLLWSRRPRKEEGAATGCGQ